MLQTLNFFLSSNTLFLICRISFQFPNNCSSFTRCQGMQILHFYSIHRPQELDYLVKKHMPTLLTFISFPEIRKADLKYTIHFNTFYLKVNSSLYFVSGFLNLGSFKLCGIKHAGWGIVGVTLCMGNQGIVGEIHSYKIFHSTCHINGMQAFICFCLIITKYAGQF